MYRTLSGRVPADPDLPARAQRLDVLRRVLNGTLYDVLSAGFHEERNGAGEYVPLKDRAPSVRSGLCRTVVDDSVSLLFSEGHFPQIDAVGNATLADDFAALIKATRLNETFIDAATRGSIGSVAILLRILKGRAFFDVLETPYLTPVWRADAPDTLERVIERYKARGHVLRDAGYAIDDDDLHLDFWFRREWDSTDETWFVPRPVRLARFGTSGLDDVPRHGRTARNAGLGDAAPGSVRPRQGRGDAPQVDASRSVTHALGFVPIVWILNLPGGDTTDGACTFRPAIETVIEIDYQLSQAGRGLRYSSDPLLLIKDPGQTDGELVKGGGNALVIGAEGDAKLLEISGAAAAAVVDYVRHLRGIALESVHGNRADPDKLAPAQSGRAMEMLNQGLIWLADRLRTSYGEHGLLSLLRMIQRASQKYPIEIVPGMPPKRLALTPVALRWPRWYAPTADDRQADASTLSTLVNAGLMARETAVKTLADTYDVEDVPMELASIAADEADADRRAAAQAAQVNASEVVEG